ncbi:MAG: DUF167 domain-containing protein [Rhodoblastus sp.]|nr:DUF167 domain-containing protein [Rhodoblastus sp.]
MAGLPWRATADGLSLVVRLTPKGGRDAIDGVETMSDGKAVLKARVRAVPEDGKANAALVEMLAKALRISRSAVTVAAGQTSRVKTLEISGDPAALAEALARAADRG